MATIEEMNNSMTIFFSKSNGSIKNVSTGIQNMNFFAENKDDFSIIWGYIILAKDDFVINNYKSFKINLETKTLEMIANAMPNYPIAGGDNNV